MILLLISITISTTTSTNCGPYTDGGNTTVPNTCNCTLVGSASTYSCDYTLYGVVSSNVTGIIITTIMITITN